MELVLDIECFAIMSNMGGTYGWYAEKGVDELVMPEGKEYLAGALDELYIRVGELIE